MPEHRILAMTGNRAAVLSTMALFLVLLLFTLGWAEGEIVTAKTYISQDGVHPGGTFDVAFLLDILPGWHINGPQLADQFLISCTLLIDEEGPVEVLELYYPEPETRAYSFSEVELQIYEGKVVLGARIQVEKSIPQGKDVLKASFLYQACDEMSCMAPETLEFAIPFQVVPASKQVNPVNEEIFSQIKFR